MVYVSEERGGGMCVSGGWGGGVAVYVLITTF